MIKAFLFDLDGVITEPSHQHYVAWKELASELGIEIDLEFNEQLKGVSRVDSLNRILERGNALGKYSDEEVNKFLEQKNEHYGEQTSMSFSLSQRKITELQIIYFTVLVGGGGGRSLCSDSKRARGGEREEEGEARRLKDYRCLRNFLLRIVSKALERQEIKAIGR